MWTQFEAIALCREVERICPQYGCHVALTGGCLYGDGKRKDCDILFYRIREVSLIDLVGLIKALESIGIKADHEENADYGDGLWVIKTWWRDKPLDMFFPEIDDGKLDRSAPGTMAMLDSLDDEARTARTLELVP